MRQQQTIRFVEQICYLLKLSQPCSKTALQYFMQFKEYDNHGYDQEILVAACIYLAVKIFQEQVRIRDILNMVYVLTALYRMSAMQANLERETKYQKMKNEKKEKKEKQQNESMAEEIPQKQQKATIRQEHQHQQQQKQKQQEQQQQQEQEQEQEQEPYILLKNIQNIQNLNQSIQPHYSLSDYNQYKGKIIQAEQMLLRILGFSFSLSEENKKELKRLLIIIHHLRIPPTMAQTILKVYNDLHYINIQYWPEGVVYFGYLVTKTFVEERQNKDQIERIEKIEKIEKQINKPEVLNPISIDLQQQSIPEPINLEEPKQAKSQKTNKKSHEKQSAQIKRINQFVKKMTSQKWQSLLATTTKLLQNYSQKLAHFYASIQVSDK